MKVDDILIEIMKDGSRLNRCVKRYSVNKYGSFSKTIFSNVVSEISIDYLNRRERIERIPDKEVPYYLAATCMNMVVSSTSKYHKNVRETINTNKSEETIWSIIPDRCTSEEDIKSKIHIEEMLDVTWVILEWLYEENKIKYFDKEMFLEYYLEEKSYRQIGRRYNITIRHIWLSVTGVVKKIKEVYYGGQHRR